MLVEAISTEFPLISLFKFVEPLLDAPAVNYCCIKNGLGERVFEHAPTKTNHHQVWSAQHHC